ncbi:fumarylacetoacetate hydrolase family protein [Pseudarthrobacter oxydans]|uniref:fumarylacetoacetate hydrolase family protein n=1 Tax=Pseudarthrobacter oxydans TaxID=1671 RepID=UPI003D29AD16
MRLVSYKSQDGWRSGALVGTTVYDIDLALVTTRKKGLGEHRTTRELLIRYGSELEDVAAAVAEAVETVPAARVGGVPEVVLGPPITDPGKVLCIGLNYKDHVTETGRALPQHPDVFAKFASTLIGPYDEINCSNVTENLDFEGELAVVIGRSGRDLSPEAAMGIVAGVTVLNDITARDLQHRGTQWLAGKAVDASTPCGPALVTLDEVGDPQNLNIATVVNGEKVQSSNTEHMIFPIAQLVSYVSQFLNLSPGDIIATGTPEGIGAKRTPPRWLRPGDVVEVELERVGTLRNVIN